MKNRTKSSWQRVKLSDVISINPKSSDVIADLDKVGFISMADVSNEAQVIRVQEKTFQEVKKGYTVFQPNDVLFAKITPCMENGKGGLVPSSYKHFFGSTEFHVLRSSDKVYPKYLFYLVNQPSFRIIAEKNMVGSAGQRRVQKEFLESYKIDLPTIIVQQKIAEILSSVDEEIQKSDQIIKKIKILKFSLMGELFIKGIGHSKFKKTNIGDIPEKWDFLPFHFVTKETRERNENEGIDSSEIYGVNKNLGLIPMKERIKGKNIKRYKVVKKGYFAYNPMRLNIGSIAYSKKEADILVSPDYVVFRTNPNKMLPDYLNYFIQSLFWSNYTKKSGDGSVRVRIYYSHLSSLYIPTPTLEEQSKIVSILNSIDQKLISENNQIDLLHQLKKGLMHDIFNQKVGVSDELYLSDFQKWLSNFPEKVRDKEKAAILDLIQNVKGVTQQSIEEILEGVDFRSQEKSIEKLEAILAELRTVIFLNNSNFVDIKLYSGKKKRKNPDISARWKSQQFTTEVACLTKKNSRDKIPGLDIYSIDDKKLLNTLESIAKNKKEQLDITKDEKKLLTFVVNRSPDLELHTLEDYKDILKNLVEKLKWGAIYHFAIVTGSEINGRQCDLIYPNLQ